MAIERCPQCHRIVSTRLDYCSCCGLSREEFDHVRNKRRKNLSRIIRSIFIVIALCAVIIAIGAKVLDAMQPLHDDSKLAYSLISSSYFFQQTKNIEVISGTATKSNSNFLKDYACLTISYLKDGKSFLGHYYITTNSVMDIQAELDKRKIGDDDYKRYYNLLRMSELKPKDMDYETITKELNKKRL